MDIPPPGYLRMTIMTRALIMERDFKTQVVECLTSEAAMGYNTSLAKAFIYQHQSWPSFLG